MKYICIKTNNLNAINYLLDNIKKIQINDVHLSYHKFKIFNNIIIFYTGTNENLFIISISNILVNLVFNVYQKNLINDIFKSEYLYFDTIQRNDILKKTNLDTAKNSNILFNIFYSFLQKEKKIYLKGFITFRLKKYMQNLTKSIDLAVNEYLIEKEYLEFISILKIYVASEESKIDKVHLIYTDTSQFLLDSNHNFIKTDINLLNAKFLSDISFSSCDIILNTLLNVLPKKIYIHMLNKKNDEFINTLHLIFENRIAFCNGCKLCNDLIKKMLGNSLF